MYELNFVFDLCIAIIYEDVKTGCLKATLGSLTLLTDYFLNL